MAVAPAAFAQVRPGGELSSTDYASAGGNESGNTGFGVKGGYNLSNFYGSGRSVLAGDHSFLHDFHAGLYGQFGFSNFSSVQVELLYSRKGIAPTGTSSTNASPRLDYLSLPVLYVANVTKNISFHLGPQVSLLTKVNAKGRDFDIGDNGFKSLDFGGVIGAEIRVGPARVGARYDVGLSRVLKEGASYVDSKTADSNFKNQTFQAYIGIGFTQ